MTAEGYKTFINGSVMASFMEGIVASILEEKSGAGYGGGFVNGHLYVHSHWH